MNNPPAWKVRVLNVLPYPVALFVFFIVETANDVRVFIWDDGKNAGVLLIVWFLAGAGLVYFYPTWWATIPLVLFFALCIFAVVISVIYVSGVFVIEFYNYIARTINELRAQTPPRKDKKDG